MFTLRKLFLALLAAVCLQSPARTQRPAVAVVVDPASSEKTAAELHTYTRALEEAQGYKVYTVVDRWGCPDSIRAELMRLHSLRHDPIVGCVLVGDIPIAMVRDAQHLCSAFKLSQERDWRESSVPSDRFYDDFGLRFRFLRKDSVEPYFYYSLSAEGEQTLRPSIFSGRIRPTDGGGTTRYDKLKAYLLKAARAKREPERVGSLFVYSGSGSLSESRVTHMDEMKAMAAHFPSLEQRPEAFSYMDFSDEPYIKTKMMNELMRPGLSIALLHHHGDWDTQFLSAYPAPQDVPSAKEYLLHCCETRILRGIRYGQNIDSVKLMLAQRYDIPAGWLEHMDEATLTAHDSANSARQDLTLSNFEAMNFRPQCRLVLLDACYNASFHRENCIANAYIFQPGATLAAIGGTVNVLQDKWPDRYLGLLARGLPLGYLTQHNTDLETHIVGDPTFAFAPEPGNTAISTWMLRQTDAALLKTLLSDAHPDLRCMALARLEQSPLLTAERLESLVRGDASAQVRLQAFLALKSRGYSPALVRAMLTASQSNYELLQRMAVNAMSKCADPALTNRYADILVRNNASARVAFNALQGAQLLNGAALLAAAEHKIDSMAPYLTVPVAYKTEKMSAIKQMADRWTDDIDKLCRGEMKPRKALQQADFMRLYLPAEQADKVARYTEQCADSTLQLRLLEAMGWHATSYKSSAMREAARRMSLDASLPAGVRAEAKKTFKRLGGGLRETGKN